MEQALVASNKKLETISAKKRQAAAARHPTVTSGNLTEGNNANEDRHSQRKPGGLKPQ
jgi:hypothetical protein